MTYLYLKSQSDDNIREEVNELFRNLHSIIRSSLVARSYSEHSQYFL